VPNFGTCSREEFLNEQKECKGNNQTVAGICKKIYSACAQKRKNKGGRDIMMTIKKDAEYQKFKANILDKLEQILPEKAKISPETIERNDVKYDGIKLVDLNTNGALQFYFEELYADYTVGAAGMDALCYQMQNAFIRYQNSDIKEITNYKDMQEKLQVRLLPKENNGKFLAQGPYKEHEMGVIIPYVMFKKEAEGAIFVRVDHELLKQWGAPEGEVIERGLKNMQEQCVVEFKSMEQMMSELLGEHWGEMPGSPIDKEAKMFVLTNEDKLYGASTILYPDALNMVYEELKQDFYILPSSVHEVIILPKDEQMLNQVKLQKMVAEVNATVVRASDFLSNKVFEYLGREKEMKQCAIDEPCVSYGRSL